MTLLLNRELVSRVKLCLVSAFSDIVKDCPKMRNLPKIFLKSFENVGPVVRTRVPHISYHTIIDVTASLTKSVVATDRITLSTSDRSIELLMKEMSQRNNE